VSRRAEGQGFHAGLRAVVQHGPQRLHSRQSVSTTLNLTVRGAVTKRLRRRPAAVRGHHIQKCQMEEVCRVRTTGVEMIL